jgi:glycosyltransferase involved in cell wall biosynthesis
MIGGIESYIKNCLSAFPNSKILNSANFSKNEIVLSLNKQIFHFHRLDSLQKLPYLSHSAIFSVHNHDIYCPSGTRFAWGSHCQIQKDLMSCTIGHLLGRCGTKNPITILKHLERSFSSTNLLKELRIPLLANSSFLKNQLLLNGFPESQVKLLHHGHYSLDPNGLLFKNKVLTSTTHKQKRIIFVGRITKHKGLDWLIRSLKLCPAVQLDVVGDGWSLNATKKLASDLDLNSRITWHGKCDRVKIEHLIQQSIALIFPSIWPEPAGLVTLEAYDQARPVIAGNVGGIPEHLEDNVTGFLIPPNDIKAMARAINLLVDDFETCKNLGINGYELLQSKFTFDKHVKKLNSIYESII